MENQTTETTNMSPEEILRFASRETSGKKLTEFNPLETIPTIGVGDLKTGQVLAGIYVETESIASAKFKFARETNEQGTPVQKRYVLDNGGQKFAIWSVGELKLIFSKMTPGQYVHLTYKGLGEVNGTEQHRFTVKVAQAN
jgi:hypothetical protein